MPSSWYVNWCKNWETLPGRCAYWRTARTDIMTAWYRSGHLLGNCDESSDKHLVEGLRDGEVELRLVPNLGPLHAAGPSSKSLRLHLDKARTSRGIPEPGRCWYCHGATWSPAQHTNIKDSKQISEPKRISIEESFIISYLLCFMAISKSPNLRSDGVVGRRWNHHVKLDDIFIASYQKHQPGPEEGSWLWGQRAAVILLTYLMTLLARMFSFLTHFLTWSEVKFTLHTSSSLLPGNICVTLHSIPLTSSSSLQYLWSWRKCKLSLSENCFV